MVLKKNNKKDKYMKNKIYISVWDMKIRKILTMSRPCPHQQHSLKETIRSNVLPDVTLWLCTATNGSCKHKQTILFNP